MSDLIKDIKAKWLPLVRVPGFVLYLVLTKLKLKRPRLEIKLE